MAWPRPDSVALAAAREPAYVEASLRGSPPCRWAQLAQPVDLQSQVVGLCEQFPLPFSEVLEAGPRCEYGVLAKSLQHALAEAIRGSRPPSQREGGPHRQ